MVEKASQESFQLKQYVKLYDLKVGSFSAFPAYLPFEEYKREEIVSILFFYHRSLKIKWKEKFILNKKNEKNNNIQNILERKSYKRNQNIKREKPK